MECSFRDLRTMYTASLQELFKKVLIRCMDPEVGNLVFFSSGMLVVELLSCFLRRYPGAVVEQESTDG